MWKERSLILIQKSFQVSKRHCVEENSKMGRGWTVHISRGVTFFTIYPVPTKGWEMTSGYFYNSKEQK